MDFAAASLTDVGIEGDGRMMFVIVGGKPTNSERNFERLPLFHTSQTKCPGVELGLTGSIDCEIAPLCVCVCVVMCKIREFSQVETKFLPL